jgi:predicted RNA binding protein YcfA (HicA-like mRNA interferase family)
MPGIKPINWKRFEKVVFFFGCEFVREKGDHRIYHKTGLLRPVVIPRDPQLPVFIIRNNLRILGVSVEEYLSALASI